VVVSKLVELLETHADHFTEDVVRDLQTNQRTRGFRAVDREELTQRIFQIVHHLGNWIGDPTSEMVHSEFADWGRRRFEQGIPLSEIVSAVLVFKQHMRRYFLDNAMIDVVFPRVDDSYVLPMHLYGLQDLTARVSRFFDEALYGLARGYEAEAKRAAAAPLTSTHHV
jgi:hypothetical protein